MNSDNPSNLPQEPDDDQMTRWLAPLADDSAPFAQGTFDRVAREAGEVFSRQPPSDRRKTIPVTAATKAGRQVIMRAAVAVSAIAVAVALMVNFGPMGGEVTLGSILDHAVAARSLELRVAVKGETAEVVVEMPERARWQTSPTRYDIAEGARLWRVDDEANTVEQESNPWFDAADRRIDLLAMIGVNGPEAARLRAVGSSEVVTLSGRPCHVFRLITTGRDARLIEAFADVETRELRTIAVWPGNKRTGSPLAELTLVRRDIPVDEAEFIVAQSLSEDGRIGKITDSQGIVTLRPMSRRRWTPVARQMLVKPGDWLRTDVRGANASAIFLTSHFQVIAGPGTLVELMGPRRLRLHGGELKVTGIATAEGLLEIVGPRGTSEAVAVKPGQSSHYRIDRDHQIISIDRVPKWLAGFEGTSSDESIGSLVANIDGRNVPLTVGYHRVSVEIRDQIARTTIEQSFVNHTRQTLEGVFHFPLPQDASISGFGMWINGELIEADVVEKQRAREIYETILRERRDPGLLEWTGGNIFKASVFPINARSEKRIKIVYTQVLPLVANRFRYNYALRSELLRKTPMRELSLEVNIHAARQLDTVTCSTHAVRSQMTDHSARLEFTAQEYTPDRDFEIVCEMNSGQADVVVVPHRRGEDGYFLVQLAPPATDGNWQRELLPDGAPLELLLVCDTSASMDLEKRRQQEECLAALLSALGPDDRFNLAVSDVQCDWLHDRPVAASDESVKVAREWLANRRSLGWTDLDGMVRSVLPRLGTRTHVVYLGDGIVTARDADPQGFVNRLNELTSDHRTGTVHAISVGNSFESAVLKAVARIGGGSVRQVGGEQTPQRVAFELLNEIAQPGLRDLRVEFRGLQVAAVYPDKLPNLAAGTQQTIIGRFLPEGADQTGEVVITGQLGGQPVRYAARITLADAESGNSFIPRLWARAHLDHLLAQGSSTAIRDEIVAMSEEYHIITPYTSLLVLETDEDRERFGVKRRYQMRDGQRFFADGRDNANYELLQQQMKRAGEWRIDLRRQLLFNLARLGRNSRLFQQLPQSYGRRGGYAMSQPVSGGAGGFIGGNEAWGFYDTLTAVDRVSGPMGEGQPADENGAIWDEEEFDFEALNEEMERERFDDDRKKGKLDVAAKQSASQAWDGDRQNNRASFDGLSDGRKDLLGQLGSLRSLDRAESAQAHLHSSSRLSGQNYTQWVSTLLPALPAATTAASAPAITWTGEALEISQSLVQAINVDASALELVRHVQTFDPRWKRTTGVRQTTELYSAKRWLSYSHSATAPTIVQWCGESERGAYSRAFRLGRVRPRHESDYNLHVPGLRAYADTPLHQTYHQYHVEVLRPAVDRVTLVLTANQSPDSQVRVTIDTTRHVVLEFEWHAKGVRTQQTKYSEYVNAGGASWPGRVESFDADGRPTSATTQTVRLLESAAFDERFDTEVANPEEAILIADPLPTVRQSEVAVADGSAKVDHRFVLLLRAMNFQNWDEAFRQFAAFEQLTSERPGASWIQAAVQMAARRNDQARQLLERLADKTLDSANLETYYLAGYVLGQSAAILDANERLRLLVRLRPVFDRQPPHVTGAHQWNARHATLLRQLGRVAEAMEVQRGVATNAPWDSSAQTVYARDLANSGDLPAALAWLREQLDRDDERHEYEWDQLRTELANLLHQHGHDSEYAEFLSDWIARKPLNEYQYQQYLGALIFDNRLDEANATALRWLEAGRIDGRLEAAAQAKLLAAIAFAGGQRYQIYANWMDPVWFAPLATTARHLLAHEHHFDLASRIVDHHRFVDTDDSDRLRAEIAQQLLDSAGTLAESRLARMIGWVVYRSDLSSEQWNAIAEVLTRRWEAAADANHRRLLGDAVQQIHAVHARETAQLPFMRRRIVRASDDENLSRLAGLRGALFQELLSRQWRDEYEAEALQLIFQLSAAEPVSLRLMVRIAALHQFTDTMLRQRSELDSRRLQDEGHPETLTRTELAEKQSEFRTSAQQALADRLADLEGVMDAAPQDPEQAELMGWVQLERLYLDVRLGRNLEQVAERCWNMLGDAPQALMLDINPADANETESARRRIIEELRRTRALTTVSYLAARRSAQASLIERLKQYTMAGVALDAESAESWKNRLFQLLVIWDQPEALENELRNWIRGSVFPAPWQLSLGRLLAERGRIDEAIQLFETVQTNSGLSADDYSILANWYLVADQRRKHHRSKIEVYLAAQEYQIINWLRQKRQPWNRTDTPLPTALDEDVLFAFQALFEKSNQPENYVYELREFYTACRDFRLLAMLPDAVVGRTAQQIYPFLKRLKSDLLHEIRNEATADEIIKRLAEVRQLRESDLDARALDLLEMLIERQSAEVLNQPGPHIEAAVAALSRAFDREWADGEVRQMADLLDSLGTLRQPALNAERLRQLRELHGRTEAGTDDRLHVAWYLAHALFHSHDRRDEGLAVMEIARREYNATHSDGWPVHANTPMEGSVNLLETMKRFSAAEQILTEHVDHPLNPSQKLWFIQRRNRTYVKALTQGGQVSFGGGADLYRQLEPHLITQLETIDSDQHRRQCLSQLLQVYQQASDKKISGYQADLKRFVSSRLPAILKRQANEYHNLVSSTAETVNRLIGPRDGLQFLIERYEDYPQRFEGTWQRPWQQLANRMAAWHEQIGRQSGDLEPRLLAIVLAELRRDLITRQSGSRYFYYHTHYAYWREKNGDFARVAEQVWAEHRDSARAVTFVADYLYHGLRRVDRGIEMMLIAHDAGMLDDAQQITLVKMLHEQDRHPESISILQPIVARSPDTMDYRTRLMTAYHRSSRPQQLTELLAATDAHFRQSGRWSESNINLLAQNCLENERFAESAGYFGEVIPLHQRSAPRRGIGGNGQLSSYYTGQSRAYSGLGDTRRAVEAAAGAVVAWGPRHEQRATALHWLEQVIVGAKDLDDYVTYVDQQADETGQDSALIRHYLGVAYAAQENHRNAIDQFKIALVLQPTNVDTYERLITSHAAIGDLDGVVAQTLAWLDVDRHNLELYKTLADRLKSDESLAERAATTVVEAAPNDAAHHEALAQLRQQQDRWLDAILHWKHVARLRSLEPHGLLQLAEAQIHEKQTEQAQATIDLLNRTQWPSRFPNVTEQVRQLQQRIGGGG